MNSIDLIMAWWLVFLIVGIVGGLLGALELIFRKDWRQISPDPWDHWLPKGD